MKHSLTFILFVIFSCNDSSKSEISLLHAKVMEVHDDVMPKTDKIHTLKKELAQAFASKNDSTALLKAMKELDDADESMMVWMTDFNPNYTSMSNEDQKAYLNAEQQKIIKVKQLILESINNSNQLLDELKKENAK